MKVKLDVENKTIIRVFLLMAGIWLAIQLVYHVRHALLLLVLSFILALALNKPVSYMASKIKKGGRGLATGIAYLVVVVILGGFVYVVTPPLVNETTRFINTIPETIDNLRDTSNGGMIADFIDKYELEDEADEFVANATGELGNLASPLVSGVGKVSAALVSVVTVLVLTFFMLIEGPSWAEKFWHFTPTDKLEHNKMLAKKMQNVVTGFVNGQLLLALMAGISSLIMMLILGLPNAVALAGVVGLFALVPMIGTITGSIIVVLVSMTQSLTTAIIMLAFFLIYQQIENNTLQPFIQSKAVDLSPLLVLVAVILGFSLGGILGGFLAIPIAAAGQVLVKDYFEQKSLAEEKKKAKKA